MPDLDDLRIFHAVVTQGSFTAAGLSLGLPKATVSKRLARLEQRLGVRLLQRSTRRLRMTETGEAVFAHAEIAVASVAGALAAAGDAVAEPAGAVTLSCPQGLLQNLVAPMLNRFLLSHPRVSLDLRRRNDPADIIAGGIDVALRVRTKLTDESTFVVRRLGVVRSLVVASPTFDPPGGSQAGGGARVDVPLLSVREHQDWWPRPESGSDRFTPANRLLCEDFSILLDAAIAGVGVALIPEHICAPMLASGALVRWFPDWAADGVAHAVFPSRLGLPSATRALIDHIASEFARRRS